MVNAYAGFEQLLKETKILGLQNKGHPCYPAPHGLCCGNENRCQPFQYNNLPHLKMGVICLAH